MKRRNKAEKAVELVGQMTLDEVGEFARGLVSRNRLWAGLIGSAISEEMNERRDTGEYTGPDA